MRPASENPQALADTAAYAQELKQAGIHDDIVDIAGYGFIRGRMVDTAQVRRSAYALSVLLGWRTEECVDHAQRAFRAAGFTVLDPPP